MKIRYWLVSCSMLSMGLFIAGCGSEPERIDPQGNKGVTTTDDINFKDWQIAAEKAVNSMLESGVLNRTDGRKTVLMVNMVKNSTNQHVNTRILTDKIRLAVLKSGKAITSTAVGLPGAEDASSKAVREIKNDPMFDQTTVQKDGTAIAPDMSLYGEIVQQQAASGRTYESYFFFHLTLTNLKTGLAEWEENVEIAKQGKLSWFGW
ncbi:MAG: penicillin-binding protein activator LpoB [Victivallaceae bacterium]